jgi:hypothetical protein
MVFIQELSIATCQKEIPVDGAGNCSLGCCVGNCSKGRRIRDSVLSCTCYYLAAEKKGEQRKQSTSTHIMVDLRGNELPSEMRKTNAGQSHRFLVPLHWV